MQKALIDSLDINLLTRSVVEASWTQWRTLGSYIDSEHHARSMVDPEALLLITLTLRHHEKRLWDILVSWAKNGSNLFSIQRVKNLLDGFPQLTKDRLAEFAQTARKEGNDFRWRSLVGSSLGPTPRNLDLWEAYPNSWHPAALMLRMRLGIGIGVPADLLSFLISIHGEWASASLIAQAIDYSVYSIRRVADDMASAQFIECTSSKPVKYRIKIEAWHTLLDIEEEFPRWHFWYQIYSFAAQAIIKVESGEWEGLSPYLLSTHLRDLFEDHRDAFILNHINVSEPKVHLGDEYIPAFTELIANLAAWINTKF